MNTARCNFAATVDETHRYIYVFGGIVGNSPADPKKPILADTIERYDGSADKWELITIKDAPKLAAFGWCSAPDTPS